MSGCDSCFSEQRSINELFDKAVNDAQQIANKEKIKVAVFQTGRSFEIQKIDGPIPAGTRHIAIPE